MTPAEIDAMGAGRELDLLIAEKVCGYRVKHEGQPVPNGWDTVEMPWGWMIGTCSYSTDLNAAVEACGERSWGVGNSRSGFMAYIAIGDQPVFLATADTPALALCRAILKATL